MAKPSPVRPHHRALSYVKLALQIVTGIYLFTALMVWLSQSRMIFRPTRPITATPDQFGLPYEDITFQAADGVRLNGWFVPTPEARGVMLLFHGNGGNISNRMDTLAIFHRLGLSTFIIDYRGYGRSEGTLSEGGTYLDAEAAWDYLVGDRGIEPGRIVVYGRSLGGVFAAYVAARRNPAGAILESALTSVADRASEMFPFFPVHRLSRFVYPTIDYIGKSQCPVLVLHSRSDQIVPFPHGQKLFEAAPQPKTFLELIGSHNDAYLASGQRYTAGVDEFLRQSLGA